MFTTGALGTQQTAAAPEPKVDPLCVTLVSRIEGLRKEGVADKIEKASIKKYKMWRRRGRARPPRTLHRPRTDACLHVDGTRPQPCGRVRRVKWTAPASARAPPARFRAEARSIPRLPQSCHTAAPGG
jgi:hypothetical protein